MKKYHNLFSVALILALFLLSGGFLGVVLQDCSCLGEKYPLFVNGGFGGCQLNLIGMLVMLCINFLAYWVLTRRMLKFSRKRMLICVLPYLLLFPLLTDVFLDLLYDRAHCLDPGWIIRFGDDMKQLNYVINQAIARTMAFGLCAVGLMWVGKVVNRKNPPD